MFSCTDFSPLLFSFLTLTVVVNRQFLHRHLFHKESNQCRSCINTIQVCIHYNIKHYTIGAFDTHQASLDVMKMHIFCIGCLKKGQKIHSFLCPLRRWNLICSFFFPTNGFSFIFFVWRQVDSAFILHVYNRTIWNIITNVDIIL